VDVEYERRFAGFAFARELGSLLAGGPAPFVADRVGGMVQNLVAGGLLRCGRLSALTAIAIWAGPETYQESITVDNTVDGRLQAVAVPIQA